MKLTEVIRKVTSAVVAFGSRFVPTESSVTPGFPAIIGTGFIVDERGLVITIEHVIEAIGKIPKPARLVMLFPEPVSECGQTRLGSRLLLFFSATRL